MQQLEVKVYIRPVEKPIPYFKEHNAQIVTKKQGQHGVEEVIKKPFLNAFIPNTMQDVQPQFESKQGKRRYSFKGTGEELQEWVKKLGLRYEDWHKRAGDTIESASIMNYGDPFFEHQAFRRKLKEGHICLDPQNATDQFLFLCLIDHPDFANAFDDKESSLNKKFIITDKIQEVRSQTEQRQKDDIAHSLYRDLILDQNQLERIAKVLNLTTGPQTNWEVVKNKMYYDFVVSKTKVADDGRTKQDVFIKVMELKEGDLEIRVLIKDAEDAGVIRYKKGKGYVFNDETIGTTKGSLIEHFKKPENRKLLSQVQEAIGINTHD